MCPLSPCPTYGILSSSLPPPLRSPPVFCPLQSATQTTPSRQRPPVRNTYDVSSSPPTASSGAGWNSLAPTGASAETAPALACYKARDVTNGGKKIPPPLTISILETQEWAGASSAAAAAAAVAASGAARSPVQSSSERKNPLFSHSNRIPRGEAASTRKPRKKDGRQSRSNSNSSKKKREEKGEQEASPKARKEQSNSMSSIGNSSRPSAGLKRHPGSYRGLRLPRFLSTGEAAMIKEGLVQRSSRGGGDGGNVGVLTKRVGKSGRSIGRVGAGVDEHNGDGDVSRHGPSDSAVEEEEEEEQGVFYSSDGGGIVKEVPSPGTTPRDDSGWGGGGGGVSRQEVGESSRPPQASLSTRSSPSSPVGRRQLLERKSVNKWAASFIGKSASAHSEDAGGGGVVALTTGTGEADKRGDGGQVGLRRGLVRAFSGTVGSVAKAPGRSGGGESSKGGVRLVGAVNPPLRGLLVREREGERGGEGNVHGYVGR